MATLVGKSLRPVRRLSGVDFEKAAAVKAAVLAIGPSDSQELGIGHDAEMGLAFPGAGAAIRGIEIIIARHQRSAQKRGAAFGRHSPPALAAPIGAIETPQ